MIFRVVFAVSLFLSTIDSLDVLNRKKQSSTNYLAEDYEVYTFMLEAAVSCL